MVFAESSRGGSGFFFEEAVERDGIKVADISSDFGDDEICLPEKSDSSFDFLLGYVFGY